LDVVTGGAGFIGSAIARAILQRAGEVRVVDNFIAASRDTVPEGADLAEVDIRDLDALEKAFNGADVIYHQAAIRSVPRSLDEPALVHECNVTGTLNVLLAAERAGATKVVYASSSSVYGGAETGASDEEMTPRPLSPYAVSKLAAEHYCRVWALLGRLPTVSLRYFNVFGPGQSAESKYSAVFPVFVSKLLRGEAPEIHWDGEQSRDFTYIDDVVRANLLAAVAPPDAVGMVFNIAPGDPRTINEIFEAIARVLRTSIDAVRAPRRPGDIRRSFANNNRAREFLAWQPTTEWDDAVERTVSWFTRTKDVPGPQSP